MSNIQRLWQAIREAGAGRYAPALARQQLLVTDVEKDSTGAVVAARGTIDGSGDFTVPVRGAGVRVGMLIGVTQPAHDPSAPLAFDGIDQSDDPTAGYFEIDPELPAPAFIGGGYTTSIVKSPGSVTARIIVNFTAVAEKYKPSSYLVSWRYPSSTGQWKDEVVPHLGGSQECALPASLPPGAAVDLKLRTRYDWAHADSVASSVVTATAAADSASPGSATTITVDNSVAGQLLVRVTAATTDADLFRQWRYEFSTSGSGPASDVITTEGPATFIGAAGAWYVRAAPVSKSGTVGTYTSWTGPTTLTAASAPLDTTAPADWSAPTVALTRVTPDTGGEYARLSVTIPARGGGYEADYDRTIVRLVNGSLYLERTLQYKGSAHDSPQVWENVAFGTWSVTLQAVDKSGNRSAVSSAGTATLAASGVPGAAGNVTTASVSLGVKLTFTKPTNATAVKIYRATDNAGTGSTVIATVDATEYIDSFAASGASAGTVRYYKIAGANIGGDGTISGTWVAGTVGAYDGANLAANTVTANSIEASMNITGKTIQTAGSGARVALEGGSNRLAIYSAGALLAALNGSALTFYRDGVNARTVFDTAGMTLYNDAGAARTVLDKDGLIVYNTGAAANRVMLQANGSMQIFSDDAASGLLLGYSGMPIGLYKVAVGGGGYATELWPNSTYGIIIANVATHGGTPGAFIALRSDGVLGFGTGAAAADVLLARMSGGSYGTGLDLAGANVKARDYYSIRATATNGVIFLGDQSGGARYLFYNGTNYVMPGVDLILNGVTVTSDRARKDRIRDAGPVAAAFDRLAVRRYTHRDDPAGRERLGLVADEVAAVVPEVVATHAPRHDDPAHTEAGLDLYGLLSLTIGALRETRADLAALRGEVAALRR